MIRRMLKNCFGRVPRAFLRRTYIERLESRVYLAADLGPLRRSALRFTGSSSTPRKRWPRTATRHKRRA
jgi:hypothetical protein